MLSGYKTPCIDVYVGDIPPNVDVLKGIKEVFPFTRREEILACKSERVRREKYCVWKLLAYALRDALGLDLAELDVRKDGRGKWKMRECCFSLSHTKGVALVAVGLDEVGVDVETPSKKLLTVADKILTDGEKIEYDKLDEWERMAYLLYKWTAKESVFKGFGKGGFVPREIDCGAYYIQTKEENGYCITVATATESIVRWHIADRYLDRADTR